MITVEEVFEILSDDRGPLFTRQSDGDTLICTCRQCEKEIYFSMAGYTVAALGQDLVAHLRGCPRRINSFRIRPA